jgi:hypothetical protein
VTAREDGWKELYGRLRRPVRLSTQAQPRLAADRPPCLPVSLCRMSTSGGARSARVPFALLSAAWSLMPDRSPPACSASSNGRLGIRRDHPAFQTFHANYEGINRPVRLPLDAGVGIIDLHASGYGFVGLDTAGGVWVWGQFRRRSSASRARSDASASDVDE